MGCNDPFSVVHRMRCVGSLTGHDGADRTLAQRELGGRNRVAATIDELVEMVGRGEIQDAKSVTGILMAYNKLS